MGCLLTSPYSPLYYVIPRSSQPVPVAETKPDEPKVYSWDQRKKIDPKDFTIENKANETVVKMPGSINGMQFIVQNLENCNVYLFDHVAQVSVDDCKNCKFFIGPSKGSVFIRDCADCSFALICQQFRTRDCKRISTFMLCATQPIIESSSGMKFGCVSINYNQLDEQLKSTKISSFNNNWNNIHDFTPVPGEQNFSFFNKDHKMVDYVPLPDLTLCSQLNVSFSRDDSIIPYTVGTHFRPANEPCLIVIFVADSSEQSAARQETQAKSVLNGLKNNNPDLTLVQTKRFNLSEVSAENVFGTKDYNKHLPKGPIIGLEYNGHDCSIKCRNAVQLLGIDLVFVSNNTNNIMHQIDNFYNFAEMQMAV